MLNDSSKSNRRIKRKNSNAPLHYKDNSNGYDYESTLPFSSSHRVTTEESLETCRQPRGAINKGIKEWKIDPNDKVWKKVIYAVNLSEETTLKVAKHMADLDAATESLR